MNEQAKTTSRRPDKLAIFDRDGTILRSETKNALYYAWEKLREEYKLQPLTDQELHNHTWGKLEDIPAICKSIIETKRDLFPETDIDQIEDRFSTLTSSILVQTKLEKALAEIRTQYDKLITTKELYIDDYRLANWEIEELNAEDVAKDYPDLSTDEQAQYIASCKAGRWKEAGELAFKQQGIYLDKAINKFQSELDEKAVYEPYSIPFSFAPNILEEMKKLKESGYFVTLATTGTPKDNEGNYFNLYQTLQFEKVLGKKPKDFFDFQINGCRESILEETIKKYRIAKNKIIAIGDDVYSISRAAKTLEIPTIAINYYLDLSLQGLDKKSFDEKNIIFCDDIRRLAELTNEKVASKRSRGF